MSNLFYIVGAVLIAIGIALSIFSNWPGCADLLSTYWCGSEAN
jgi:hypothetical protein